MEERFEMKMYGINYKCKMCGTGNMIKSNGLMLTCDPPKFAHKCDNCGAETYLNDNYPMIKYEKLQ